MPRYLIELDVTSPEADNLVFNIACDLADQYNAAGGYVYVLSAFQDGGSTLISEGDLVYG